MIFHRRENPRRRIERNLAKAKREMNGMRIAEFSAGMVDAREKRIEALAPLAGNKANQKWWPLSYVVVWICFRDHKRALGAFGRQQTLHPNTLGLDVAMTRGIHPEIDLTMPNEAVNQLLDALRDDRLKSSGVPYGNGSGVREITSVEWLVLRLSLNGYSELIDTNGCPAFCNVFVSSEGVLDCWPAREEAASEEALKLAVMANPMEGARSLQIVDQAQSQQRQKKRRGPKPKYDQAQFVAQVVEKLRDEGGLAPANGSSFRQCRLEEYMHDWCERNWEHTPSESTLRDYVSEGIKRYEADNSGL